MTYQFDTDIAQEFGVPEAIMIYNLAFWIRKNEANGRHFHDGRFWTYNSAEAFTKLFPFWTSGQIRRILSSLEDKGVLLTGNFNASQYDRTKWYAFTDSMLQKLQMHLSILTNGSLDSESCNNIGTDSNTNPIKPDNDFAEGEIFYTPSSEREKKPRGTSDKRECLFVDSRFYDFDAFKAQFAKDPKYAGADIEFYYERIKNWSAAKARKKKDWIAFTRNWMLSDYQDGKLKKAPAPFGSSISQEDLEELRKYAEL